MHEEKWASAKVELAIGRAWLRRVGGQIGETRNRNHLESRGKKPYPFKWINLVRASGLHVDSNRADIYSRTSERKLFSKCLRTPRIESRAEKRRGEKGNIFSTFSNLTRRGRLDLFPYFCQGYSKTGEEVSRPLFTDCLL